MQFKKILLETVDMATLTCRSAIVLVKAITLVFQQLHAEPNTNRNRYLNRVTTGTVAVRQGDRISHRF